MISSQISTSKLNEEKFLGRTGILENLYEVQSKETHLTKSPPITITNEQKPDEAFILKMFAQCH